jgi:2-polyprenyl-6-methoxyphenol hydroxylase-like FAD-dependent oxidoreductase
MAYRESMKHTSRAIVIGGGIAGPAVSLVLQRGGIEPRLFEAYPGPATIGGGFQIAPNGMRVMAALGLAEQVASAGVPSREFVFRNRNGATLARIELRRSGFGVTILRSAFHRILLEEMQRCRIHVAYGKRLVAIEQDAGAVVARFADGTTVEGDVLLASDGVHSSVRGLILPGAARPRYTGVIGIGGFPAPEAECPRDPRDACQLNFTMGGRLQFGYANMSAGEPRWGWWTHLPQATELSREAVQAIPDHQIRAELLNAFSGWHAPIESMIRATPEMLRTAIYDVPQLPTWHVGRVMLLGDAAHAMSPAGGQGASLALEDAIVVGRSLAVDRESPPEHVFGAAESRLRPRAERMVKQAAANDARQLKELGRAGEWVRDRLFPLLTPLIARQLEREYAALEDIAAAA